MAVNIHQIMDLSGQAAIDTMRKPYVYIRSTQLLEMAGYVAYIQDIVTGRLVPMVWTHNDDIRAQTENDKIALARQLLENGVNSLTDLLELHPLPTILGEEYETVEKD